MATFTGGGNGNVTYNGGNLYDSNGVAIDFSTPKYTYGDQPNPWDVPDYTEILLDPSCLTGSGAQTQGIKMRTDGTNWQFADAGQILYSKTGSLASPLVSGVAGAAASAETNMWGSLNPIMIPAYMMYKDFRGRLKCTLRKTNANAVWQIWIRIGKTAPGGSVTQNDQLFVITSLTNADNRQYQVDCEFTLTSAGVSVSGAIAGETTCTYITKMSLQPNAGGTDIVKDKGALMSTVDDVYININVIGSTSDTFSLIDYTFIAMPI